MCYFLPELIMGVAIAHAVLHEECIVSTIVAALFPVGYLGFQGARYVFSMFNK